MNSNWRGRINHKSIGRWYMHFLKNQCQVNLIIQSLNIFSKASGLVVNTKKSEIMFIHDSDVTSVDGILVKDVVKYLGIYICKSAQERISLNFHPKLDFAKRIFSLWLQRDLTIYGRILLSKAESMSRFIYPSIPLYIDSNTCKSIDSLNFKFIWINKVEHISRKFLTQPYSNQIFKINWLKKCLKGNSVWFWIPNMIFKRCGNLQFLLSCDFKSTRLPVKLSNFHKQALDSWKLIFKHNFSPHIIWNNQYVLSARKSVFFPDWFSKGIVFISDLISNSGDCYAYVDFLNKYDKCFKTGLYYSYKFHSS